MSQPDVLAIFTPQVPVEQVAAPQKHDSAEDDGFQRIMDDAAHRASPARENNKPETDRQDHSSAQSPSDKKPTKKPKLAESKETDRTTPQETDQTTPKEPLNQTQPTQKESENVSPQELASVNNFQEAVDHLKELGFDVKVIATLLELFESDSGVDVGTLLQSLTAQTSQLNDFLLKDFLAANSLDESSLSQLENRKILISDLLKRVGLTDQEAKHLIEKFQAQQISVSNLKNRPTEQVLTTTKKDLEQPEVVNLAAKDVINKNISKQKNKESSLLDKNLNSQLEVKTKVQESTAQKSGIEKGLNREASQQQNNTASMANEKVASTNEKLESQHAALEKTTTQNTIGMKYSDTSGLQTAKSKSLEAIKANGEVQVQNINAASENANKTISATKATLPENPIYKTSIENRLIDQIINRLSVRSSGSQSEVKIQLDPPSLGRVRMNITTSGDGVRTLIVAENQAVKQVIENNLSQLRDSMAGQGLKLDGFSVLVGGDSNPEFSQQRDNLGQSDAKDFDYVNENELETETNEEPVRQTSFIFDDISQTVSIVA